MRITWTRARIVDVDALQIHRRCRLIKISVELDVEVTGKQHVKITLYCISAKCIFDTMFNTFPLVLLPRD